MTLRLINDNGTLKAENPDTGNTVPIELGESVIQALSVSSAPSNSDDVLRQTDAATLSALNTLVGDATLDDSGDSRPPDSHTLGGSEHDSDTISNLNSKISDATLDDSGDSRPPQSHDNGAHSTAFVPQTDVGSADGVASLASGGKLTRSEVPPLAITQTHTVSAESDLTGLSNANEGDVGIVTNPDPTETYILSGSDPSQSGNWVKIAIETAPISSVNSQTGDVSLSAGDVGAVATGGHGNAEHSKEFVSDGDGTTRQIWVIANGASDPAGAGPEDIIFEEQ